MCAERRGSFPAACAVLPAGSDEAMVCPSGLRALEEPNCSEAENYCTPKKCGRLTAREIPHFVVKLTHIPIAYRLSNCVDLVGGTVDVLTGLRNFPFEFPCRTMNHLCDIHFIGGAGSQFLGRGTLSMVRASETIRIASGRDSVITERFVAALHLRMVAPAMMTSAFHHHTFFRRGVHASRARLLYYPTVKQKKSALPKQGGFLHFKV